MLNILEPPFGLRGAHAKYLLAHYSAWTAEQAGDIHRFCIACTCYHKGKGAGTSETPGQTKEELSANDTSRHPKVLKIGPNHGCQ